MPRLNRCLFELGFFLRNPLSEVDLSPSLFGKKVYDFFPHLGKKVYDFSLIWQNKNKSCVCLLTK